MNIRLTRLSGKELNILATQLAAFMPSDDPKNVGGSVVVITAGVEYEVTQSTRSIRGYVAKAFEPAHDYQVSSGPTDMLASVEP